MTWSGSAGVGRYFRWNGKGPAPCRRRDISLGVPTLMVWGDHDLVGAVRVAHAVADAIPTARLELLPAGHVPSLGNPDRTAELVSTLSLADAPFKRPLLDRRPRRHPDRPTLQRTGGPPGQRGARFARCHRTLVPVGDRVAGGRVGRPHRSPANGPVGGGRELLGEVCAACVKDRRRRSAWATARTQCSRSPCAPHPARGGRNSSVGSRR